MHNARRSNGHRRDALLRWARASFTECWMCGLPIDPTAPPGDPLAFEADEIVPVSLGGSPLDRANVRGSHRCCNNWRKNKTVGKVESIRAKAAAAFGSWSSPQDFVRLMKAAERERSIGPSRRPPVTTTEW